MRPVIYEDESGAWDADDISELIKELEQYKAVVDAAKVFDEVVAWEAQGNSDWPEMAGLHEALSNLKEKG